jgi:hypothetical protein
MWKSVEYFVGGIAVSPSHGVTTVVMPWVLVAHYLLTIFQSREQATLYAFFVIYLFILIIF